MVSGGDISVSTLSAVGRGARRALEALIAAVILAAVAPVVLVAAVMSAAHYRAWPFFTHDRVGWRGSNISITKIRTLPCSTGTHIDKYQLRSIDVPRPMQQLRKLHLDELPQLVAVISGKLSFVGPRPEMRPLHDRFSRGFADERTSVRPGITGLWQVSDGVVSLIGETPEYDLFYVRHRNLRLDLWVLYRTVIKVLVGTTVALADVPSWVLPADAAGVGAGPSVGATPSVASSAEPSGV